jgi:hypothetical protein
MEWGIGVAVVLLLLLRGGGGSSGLVTKNDYVACYSDLSQSDSDPVLLRKGVAVVAVGPPQGGMLPITIPEGTPIFSTVAVDLGSYGIHNPIDYTATYYTPTRNVG